jgi:uracil-DNA glycosylase
MSATSASTDGDQVAALTAFFAWHEAMGVDAILGDAPVDRFAEPQRAPPPPTTRRADPRVRPEPSPPPAAPAVVTVPNEEAGMAARAAAASADSLDALKGLLETFDGCNLKLTAKSLVFGDGNPAARLMLVGEAPDRDEDMAGRPFVGRPGQLLDRMLAAAGFSRAENVYIANSVYWRPPGNRDPSDVEVAICRPFILRQIELVDPDVLMFLGAQPLRVLVGDEIAKAGIRRARGQWLEFDTGRRTIPALPTYHPAYLLGQPLQKRDVWQDLLAVRERLAGAEGGAGS